VDLFSALAVMTLGLALFSSQALEETGREVGQLRRENAEIRQRLSEPQALAQQYYRAIVQQGLANVRVFPCSERARGQVGGVGPPAQPAHLDALSEDEVCLDVALEFSRDSDVLSEPAQATLQSIGTALKGHLDGTDVGATTPRRAYGQIVVEGHTDDTQNWRLSDPRLHFKHNWDLSARRASAVLYELRRNGLAAGEYNLVAWGRADSEPRCSDASEECRSRNRRTTLRLRFDYESYRRSRRPGP
jgi:outer membrane protein OmpA-like peptidoglycan-associated protein